jgi:lysophospholipase L1-like esterase
MNLMTGLGTIREFLHFLSARKRRVLIIFLISVAAALIVGELELRVIGFSYRTFPTVQFGWPEPEMIAQQYVPDPQLFWVTKDYQEQLAGARKSNVAVVFMGDSCTQFGTYPTHVLERLGMDRPALATGVNLAVGGWSTEQGLAQFERDVLPLHPKVITIYFGWNDHWIALGPPDEAATPSPVVFCLSQHSRLAQLVAKVRLGLTSTSTAQRPNRVNLDRYRRNLETMVRLAQKDGIVVVLITAPSSHVKGSEPSYLATRHLRTLSELVPLHQAYVKTTREVALREGATLCDAVAAFETFSPPREQYFIRDGIHLSQAGNQQMARLVTECIERAVEP